MPIIFGQFCICICFIFFSNHPNLQKTSSSFLPVIVGKSARTVFKGLTPTFILILRLTSFQSSSSSSQLLLSLLALSLLSSSSSSSYWFKWITLHHDHVVHLQKSPWLQVALFIIVADCPCKSHHYLIIIVRSYSSIGNQNDFPPTTGCSWSGLQSRERLREKMKLHHSIKSAAATQAPLKPF